VSAIALGLVGLIAHLGFDASVSEQWVRTSASWVDGNVERTQSYLAGLLPSATAAGAGAQENGRPILGVRLPPASGLCRGANGNGKMAGGQGKGITNEHLDFVWSQAKRVNDAYPMEILRFLEVLTQ